MINYLGISLEKLLKFELLKDAKVLAGSAGLNNRISKVNVMEVPDIIDWVSTGDFLLTTAYSIKDNIDVLCQLIPELGRKGVAGLGIKVHRYINEIPQNIIDKAEEINFPIIEIPLMISYTDVISIIQDEIIDEQMEKLLRIEKFNREVMDTMVKGGTLKDIAKKLFDSIGNSLAIYDSHNSHYEIISNVISQKDILDIINKHLNSACLNSDPDGTFTESEDIIKGSRVKRVTYPIIIDKIDYGYIYIWLDSRMLETIDKILIESYVHIIALDFVENMSLLNMESNYKLEFFNDLLSSSKTRHNQAVERAKAYNFRTEMRYSVIVVYFNKAVRENRFPSSRQDIRKSVINGILFIINRLSASETANILYVDKSDKVVILYGSDPAEDSITIKENTKSFSSRLLKEALEKYREPQFKIGIGRPYTYHGELWQSYEEAQFVTEMLPVTSAGIIMHYDDLGLYRLLCSQGLRGELVKFCNDTIKSLVDYDKLNNTEMVKTLKYFFQCNGNLKKISKEMFMHYNTIVYRMQKIRDITGMDLDNSENRLNLQIALKALDIIATN